MHCAQLEIRVATVLVDSDTERIKERGLWYLSTELSLLQMRCVGLNLGGCKGLAGRHKAACVLLERLQR